MDNAKEEHCLIGVIRWDCEKKEERCRMGSNGWNVFFLSNCTIIKSKRDVNFVFVLSFFLI